MNTGRIRFADVSAVSGLDFPDDGRCLAPVDWDLDGDLDLWISNRTGPTLRFVRNGGTSGHHFLALRLIGDTCNRDAVGARVELVTSRETLIRSLHAGDGYLSQGSKWVHFGLGAETTVAAVKVHWPGGEVEQFSNCTADGRFQLQQGTGTATKWIPPERVVELTPSRLETTHSPRARRIVLRDRVPMPDLSCMSFDGESFSISPEVRQPVLVNLWATWCAPCLVELTDFAQHETRIRDAGVDIVALNVEISGTDTTVDRDKAKLMLKQQIKFPFRSGMANQETLETLDAFQEILISLREESGQLPSSFLIDQHGRMAVIYPGPVSVDQLCADVRNLQESSKSGLDREIAGLPFPGQWFIDVLQSDEVLIQLVNELQQRHLDDGALQLGGLAADLTSRRGVQKANRLRLADLFYKAGQDSLNRREFQTAVRYLGEAVRLRPEWIEAQTNLGNAYSGLNLLSLAEQQYLQALQTDPQFVYPHLNLGVLYLNQGQNERAAQHLHAVIQLQPGLADAHNHMGVALARLGHQQQSLNHLNEAIRLNPSHAAALDNRQIVLSRQVP